MHDSVYEMAGDPRIAKALRLGLERIADGPDGPLKEMAEGVLAGNLDLREAASSEVYGEALGVAAGRFWTGYEQVGEDERTELIRRAESRLDELLES